MELDEHDILLQKIAHRKQLVLPEEHKTRYLKELHDQGTDRTCLIRDRSFWPYVQREIQQYVMNCSYLKQKKPSP